MSCAGPESLQGGEHQVASRSLREGFPAAEEGHRGTFCADVPVVYANPRRCTCNLNVGSLQVEALTADKRNLSKLLQQRDAEIDDLHKRHRQSLVSVALLPAQAAHWASHPVCYRGLRKYLVHFPSPSLQDKTVSLSDANATLDAAAHEAKAAQNRTQQEKVQASHTSLPCETLSTCTPRCQRQV